MDWKATAHVEGWKETTDDFGRPILFHSELDRIWPLNGPDDYEAACLDVGYDPLTPHAL